MGIFDQLKNKAQTAAQTAINNLGNQREKFTFTALPENVDQMRTLPEAAIWLHITLCLVSWETVCIGINHYRR